MQHGAVVLRAERRREVHQLRGEGTLKISFARRRRRQQCSIFSSVYFFNVDVNARVPHSATRSGRVYYTEVTLLQRNTRISRSYNAHAGRCNFPRARAKFLSRPLLNSARRHVLFYVSPCAMCVPLSTATRASLIICAFIRHSIGSGTWNRRVRLSPSSCTRNELSLTVTTRASRNSTGY